MPLSSLCKSLLAAALLASTANTALAEVKVESWNVTINQESTAAAASYQWYPLQLMAGAKINVTVQANGGFDNAIQVWLVDLQNFELLKTNREFSIWLGTSPKVTGRASFSFTAPTTNVYNLVLDNRTAITPRNLAVYLETESITPDAWATATANELSTRYDLLKLQFEFPDFDINVKSCGDANAFSNPNITICRELLQDLAQKNVPAAEVFIFYHEVAHTLLYLWGEPGFDNEDTADEFATAMMIMTDQQIVALQAAQWFARADSQSEASQTLAKDNPHSLSIQRARNIIKWLNQKDERLTRWVRMLAPHMTESALASEMTKAPPIADIAEKELSRRHQLAQN